MKNTNHPPVFCDLASTFVFSSAQNHAQAGDYVMKLSNWITLFISTFAVAGYRKRLTKPAE